MTGHTDGAGMVGQGTGDALANPPGSVGAELEAQPIVEFVHRPHQAAIAFLNQVREGQTPAAIRLAIETTRRRFPSAGCAGRPSGSSRRRRSWTREQAGQVFHGRAGFQLQVTQCLDLLEAPVAVGRRAAS